LFFGTSNEPLGLPSPVELDGGPVSAAIYVVVNKPRGFKYGLINANPVKSSAVYRTNRYGQLRDMLEQRPYAYYQYTATEPTYISVPAAKMHFSPFGGGRPAQQDSKSLVKRIPGKFEITKLPPIEVRFQQPSWMNPLSTSTQIPPEETQSSNLSVFATSSMPYFDGVVKNRDALTSDGDVEVVLD